MFFKEVKFFIRIAKHYKNNKVVDDNNVMQLYLFSSHFISSPAVSLAEAFFMATFRPGAPGFQAETRKKALIAEVEERGILSE